MIRKDPLTAREIIEFSQKGFLMPGRVFTNDVIESMIQALSKVQESEREAGREYDLLDPESWPTKEKESRSQPGKTVGFLFNLWLHNNHKYLIILSLCKFAN